jgi:hypothetical protein
VSATGITDELVQQVADDLRARYGLDDEGVRALGSRLAGFRSFRQRGEPRVHRSDRHASAHHAR